MQNQLSAQILPLKIFIRLGEYHYELTKDMTTQERISFYNEGGRDFLEEIEERKLKKV